LQGSTIPEVRRFHELWTAPAAPGDEENASKRRAGEYLDDLPAARRLVVGRS
jgi:hypothetical protein